MIFATSEGQFKKFTGLIETEESDFSNSKVNFSVQANSINTNNKERDEHLRNKDFFDVTQYPELTLESTNIEALGENKYNLYGKLTIHGITKPVIFELIKEKLPTGKILYLAKCEINRLDYNVGESSLMLGNKVSLHIKIALKE